jgi:hypothetical protein
VLKYRTLQQDPSAPRGPLPGMPAPGAGPRQELVNANANPAPDDAALGEVLKLAVADAQAALAQTETAGTITKLMTIDVQQVGKAPTGPYPVVVEHDPKLATHTIYRPSELSMDKHPVLVWGEGGCAKNGLLFPEYLSAPRTIRVSRPSASGTAAYSRTQVTPRFTPAFTAP